MKKNTLISTAIFGGLLLAVLIGSFRVYAGSPAGLGIYPLISFTGATNGIIGGATSNYCATGSIVYGGVTNTQLVPSNIVSVAGLNQATIVLSALAGSTGSNGLFIVGATLSYDGQTWAAPIYCTNTGTVLLNVASNYLWTQQYTFPCSNAVSMGLYSINPASSVGGASGSTNNITNLYGYFALMPQTVQTRALIGGQ